MTKELKLVGGISLLVLILLIGVCFAMTGKPPVEEPIYQLPVADALVLPASMPQTVDEPRYILRSDSGSLAVYRQGSDAPMLSLDVSADKLRSVDAAALATGIEVEGDEALWRLIEDFSS